MADTVTIPINDSDWTEIQQGISGLITNHSFHDIKLREAAVKPNSSVKTGHIVHPRENMTYGVMGAQKIFARSNRGVAQVVITEAT